MQSMLGSLQTCCVGELHPTASKKEGCLETTLFAVFLAFRWRQRSWDGFTASFTVYLNNSRDAGNVPIPHFKPRPPKVHLSSHFDSLACVSMKRREWLLTRCLA